MKNDIILRRINRRNWHKWAREVMPIMRAALPKETGLTAKDIRNNFNDGGRQITLLATSGDEVAGFAIGFFHVFEEYPEIVAIGDTNIFHLCVNIVAPKFQGQGLGTRLLKERIAYGKKRGARTCSERPWRPSSA